MNEFTKEELQLLLCDLNAKIFDIGEEFINEFNLKLRNKIELIIKDYCEHSPDYYQPCHITCVKCDKILI